MRLNRLGPRCNQIFARLHLQNLTGKPMLHPIFGRLADAPSVADPPPAGPEHLSHGSHRYKVAEVVRIHRRRRNQTIGARMASHTTVTGPSSATKRTTPIALSTAPR